MLGMPIVIFSSSWNFAFHWDNIDSLYKKTNGMIFFH